MAFDLKEFDIDKDNLELGSLIREAYGVLQPRLSAFKLVGKRMAQSNESLRGLQELADGFTKKLVQAQV